MGAANGLSPRAREVTPPIAILGCGPSGLMAAWAAILSGVPPVIFSRYEKSQLGGAQFLHKPIPGITEDEPEFEIDHITRGTIQEYREKVYGSEFDLPQDPLNVMPQTGEKLPGWSLQRAYDKLWDMFYNAINNVDIKPEWVAEKQQEFPLILSTVPATRLCKEPDKHKFVSQRIRIACNTCVEPTPENTIIFDGTPFRTWYRCANVNGFKSTEWSDNPLTRKVPISTINALKPLSTNCNCHEGPGFIRLGRRGTWLKSEFTHHAFYKTLERLNGQ